MISVALQYLVEYIRSIQETQREVGSILLKEAVLVVGRLTVSHNV